MAAESFGVDRPPSRICVTVSVGAVAKTGLKILFLLPPRAVSRRRFSFA
jgi:hypothetical protein